MKRSAVLAAAVAAALGSACADQQSPLAPPADPTPFLQIRDDFGSSNPKFLFLAPIRLSELRGRTGFNPDLRPVVEICKLTGTAAGAPCDATPPTRLTMTSGTTLLNRVFVLRTHNEYAALWGVRNLVQGKRYRISVLVGGQVLGFADLDVVRTLSDLLKYPDRGNFVPLLRDFILPIRFWIGGGALCEPSTSACSSETVQFGATAPAATVELQAGGEVFRLDIDAGTQATSGGRPVSEVTFNLELCDDPIDVDLPKFGQCLRVTALFGTTGTAELVFVNKAARVSMCSFSVAPEESQEQLVTLHQQDGDLIRALPHVGPNCDAPEPGAPSQLGDAGGHRLGRLILVGWRRVRDGVAALVAPRPLFARSRVALLDLGGGGQTHRLGLPTCTSGSPPVAGLALATCIPAVAPQLVTPDPTTGHTISDFQFALPAKINYVDSEEEDPSVLSAPAGTPMVFQVSATDARQAVITDAQAGVTTGGFVTFTITEGDEVVDVVTEPVVGGVAQITRILAAGTTTVVASGFGFATPTVNGPLGTFDPFWPDFDAPSIAESEIQLLPATLVFTATGTVVEGLRFREITVGQAVTCGGLNGDSTAWCWGVNGQFDPYGTLGTFGALEMCGLFPCSRTPVPIPGGVKFSLLSAGANHVCGINAYVTGVYCWGRGNVGQLGNGTTDSSATPQEVGAPRMGVVTSGGLTEAHTCGLGSDGVYCWGANGFGQLGNGGTANSSTPVLVSAPEGVTFTTTISAGGKHTCAVTSDFDLYCWGSNTRGELGDGTTISSSTPVLVAGERSWATVSAGHEHTCAIERTLPTGFGPTYCWGRNDSGQLGDGTTTDAFVPTAVSTELSFFSIGAGGFHSCALASGGAAYCWGGNLSGELGTGSFTASSTCEVPGISGGTQPCELTPVPVTGGLSFQQIDAHGSGDHVCGLATDEGPPIAYCWGLNNVGQLGIDAAGNRAAPTRVARQ